MAGNQTGGRVLRRARARKDGKNATSNNTSSQFWPSQTVDRKLFLTVAVAEGGYTGIQLGQNEVCSVCSGKELPFVKSAGIQINSSANQSSATLNTRALH